MRACGTSPPTSNGLPIKEAKTILYRATEIARRKQPCRNFRKRKRLPLLPNPSDERRMGDLGEE